MKELIKRRRLIPIALWLMAFLALFGYLEVNPPRDAHLISCGLDAAIPCVPQFIYPYLSWFPYIGVCVCRAVWHLRDEDYLRSASALAMGMNVFLAISYFWPTGLDFRESIVYDLSTLSGRLMKFVQTVDTPRSVFPSMHVYVTLVLQHTLELQKDSLPVWGIWSGRALAALIVCSTVFTKQHSVLDVAGAAVMFALIMAGLALIPENLFRKNSRLRSGQAGKNRLE